MWQMALIPWHWCILRITRSGRQSTIHMPPESSCYTTANKFVFHLEAMTANERAEENQKEFESSAAKRWAPNSNNVNALLWLKWYECFEWSLTVFSVFERIIHFYNSSVNICSYAHNCDWEREWDTQTHSIARATRGGGEGTGSQQRTTTLNILIQPILYELYIVQKYILHNKI